MRTDTQTTAYCVEKYAEAANLALLRGLTLDERERITYANGDREAHAIITAAELGAEDLAADLAEGIENDADLVKAAKETAAKLDAANVENARLLGELSKSRQLADSVRFVLSPYTGQQYGRQVCAPKPAPKWAQHLIRTLARLEQKP